MKTLCKNTQVRYFRFHALRRLGASILDRANVNVGSIQSILGHENRTTTEPNLHSIGDAERESGHIGTPLDAKLPNLLGCGTRKCMPRLARLDAPGVLHHLMIGGIERRKIF